MGDAECTPGSSAGEHWRAFPWNVAASLVATAIALGVQQFAPTLIRSIGGIAPSFLTTPLWLLLFTTFFTVLGGITAAQQVWKALRYTLNELPKQDAPRGSHDLAILSQQVEIDLRSTAPIILLKNAATPQFSIWLRLTNHSSLTLRVTHLTIEVWFGQPALKVSLDQPISVRPHSTATDIRLADVLDASKVAYINGYLTSSDYGKTLFLDIRATIETTEGHFSKDVKIERRDPELSTIIR